MRAALELKAVAISIDTTFAHHRVANNQRRTLVLLQSLIQSLADFVRVVAVNLNYVPIPCTIFCSGVFRCNIIHHCRQLHLVAVIEHYQVAQSKISSQASCSLRNLLLDTAVRDKSISFMRNDLTKTGCYKTLGDGCANCHCMSLSERTRTVLDASANIHFRVSGRNTAPLTQILQILYREFTTHSQNAIKHRRHVSGIQEKPVTGKPFRIIWVVDDVFGIQSIHIVCATHRASRVSRLCLLHHCGLQYADIVRNLSHCFCIHCH